MQVYPMEYYLNIINPIKAKNPENEILQIPEMIQAL